MLLTSCRFRIAATTTTTTTTTTPTTTTTTTTNCVVLLLIVLFCINCVVLCNVCKCVLYYCHRVSTQLQLTNTSTSTAAAATTTTTTTTTTNNNNNNNNYYYYYYFGAEYFVFQFAIQKFKDHDIYRIIISSFVLYGCETWSLA